MSHESKYFDVKVKGFDKKKFASGVNDYVKHATWEEGGHGLCCPIRYLDHLCDDYDDAVEYINKHATHDYDQVAVKFKYPLTNGPTKAEKAAEAKLSETYKAYNALNSALHFANVKADYIGCKECGSKIARKFLQSNFCPVCRHDLRPQSTLDRLTRLKAAWLKARDDLDAVRKKEQAKAPCEEHWLVRIVYHV